MFTMRPRTLRSSIVRATAREVRNAPLRFHAEHGVPRVLGEVHDGHAVGAGGRGGVVDQDVDAAECIQRLPHGRADLTGRTNVDQRGNGAPPGFLDLFRHGVEPAPAARRLGRHHLGARRRHVGQHEIAAFGGQAAGDGASEPVLAAAARDHRDLACQGHH